VEIAVAGAAHADTHAAIEAAFAVVAKVHGLMSFHDAGSDVGRLNGKAWSRPVGVHAWTFRVIEAANGPQALKILDGDQQIDLLFCSLNVMAQCL